MPSDPLQQRFVRAYKQMEYCERDRLVLSLERVSARPDAEVFGASAMLATGEIQASDQDPQSANNRQNT